MRNAVVKIMQWKRPVSVIKSTPTRKPVKAQSKPIKMQSQPIKIPAKATVTKVKALKAQPKPVKKAKVASAVSVAKCGKYPCSDYQVNLFGGFGMYVLGSVLRRLWRCFWISFGSVWNLDRFGMCWN